MRAGCTWSIGLKIEVLGQGDPFIIEDRLVGARAVQRAGEPYVVQHVGARVGTPTDPEFLVIHGSCVSGPGGPLRGDDIGL